MPPATGIISAYEVRDNSGAIIAVNQSNCRLNNNANPYFCGTTPKLSAVTPAQTAVVTPALLASLRNPAGRVVSPENGPLDGNGLKARDFHFHLAADYDVSDSITLSSLSAYNKGRYSELADLDNLGSTNSTFFGSNTGYNFAFLVEGISKDYSQEVRATYGNDGPFHATVGASYLYSRTQSALGGNGGSIIAPLTVTTGGAFVTKTKGAFFGLSYDVTDQFSLNFDGRYQVDKNITYAAPAGITVTSPGFGVPTGFYAGGKEVVHGTYKNFMPRAIAQYKWDPDNMMYASYSKGINPGVFNTGFLTPASHGRKSSRSPRDSEQTASGGRS